MKQFCLGIIVAIGLTLPAFGQGVDPLIGTWKINLEKSTSTNPLPKSTILTWAGEGQNFISTAEGADDQGRAFKYVTMHIYDGMPHPSTGNPSYDASAYTRTGNTLYFTRLKNGKLVGLGQAIIVPGKTYTLIIGGIDANNKPYYAAYVYDRQ
jgi:hypothetical protein